MDCYSLIKKSKLIPFVKDTKKEGVDSMNQRSFTWHYFFDSEFVIMKTGLEHISC